MKQLIKAGQTDYTDLVFIKDTTSPIGAGLSGLDETKIDISYTRANTNNQVVNTACAPAALASLTAAHTDWGFEEVSATEAKGLYRLDFADGVFAAGAWSAVVNIRDAGSNNVYCEPIQFQISAPVDIYSISEDSAAADNLELQFDGTGYLHGTAPARQDQISVIGGGLSVQETIDSSTVISGSAAGAVSLMNSDDNNRYVVTADAGTGALEFILKVSPTDTEGHVSEIHFHGFYDEATGATNSCLMQAYNFNSAAWETVLTLTNAGADQNFDVPLHVGNQTGTSVTVETVACVLGDVLVKFKQNVNEIGSTVNIDYMTLGFAGSALTAAVVLTQVNTALDTAISELSQAAPTATPTMRTGLMLLYMALRNRLDVDTTSNFKEVHNNAGTVICKKALTDDGSVYSEAEMESGP